MRNTAWLVMCWVLAGCNSISRDGISVEAHGYGEKKPIRRVFVEYSGSRAVTDRFSKVLAIAFMDNGLEMETDRKKAEGVVTVRAEEKTGPTPVYAKMLRARVSVRDGRNYVLDECQYTSEQVIEDSSSWSYPQRVYLAQTIRKIAPALATLYVGPIKDDKDSALSNAIKAELQEGHYALALNREQADASLEEVRPHMGQIPLIALQQHVSLEATVEGWNGYSFTANAVRNLYRTPDEPLPEEVRPCATSVSLYTRNNSRDATWDAADRLARSLAHK
jgi:hypothetical protein